MKVYSSRRSIILGILLWGMLITPILLMSPVFEKSLIFIVFYLLILVVVALIWFGIRYIIDGKLLRVMIGPICLCKIPINEIRSIDRSYNPLSSPAASLKRIRIVFRGEEVLISPNKEKQFVSDLEEINPSFTSKISNEEGNKSILVRFLNAIL